MNQSAPANEVPPTAVFIERGTPQFRRTSWALLAGGFSSFALLYCVQPMMPALSQAFSISAAQCSLILSVSTITLALGLIFTGPISDAIGRKPIMVVALLAAAFSTMIAALMPTWQGLLLMRALVGLSLSGITALAVTYLSEEIHPRHIGVAIGLYIGGSAIGGMSGRLVSGLILEYGSWRLAIAAMGTAALLAALLFWRYLPDSRHFTPRPINAKNLAGGFLLHFQTPALRLLFLQAFLLMGSLVTFFNYIGYHLLQAPFFLSQQTVSLLSFVYLTGLYSSAKIGSLADRLGRPKVFWKIILLTLFGVVLTLVDNLVSLVAGTIVFTFGFFGSHAVASSWIGRCAKTAKGQATSLYQIFFYIGASVAGTWGGVFWQQAQWLGVGSFIVGMLIISLLVSWRLSRES
nr:MFS transporter [Pseudomonas amygdali]